MRRTGNHGSGRYQGNSQRQAGAAQRGLWLYRLNLEHQREWAGKWYAVQQVAPVVEERTDRLVVVTVYTYYF
jgi:hypothetical protein